MKLLIDTHYLLWMFMDTEKISEKVKQALLSAENVVYYVRQVYGKYLSSILWASCL